jgi:hypothetical protein
MIVTILDTIIDRRAEWGVTCNELAKQVRCATGIVDSEPIVFAIYSAIGRGIFVLKNNGRVYPGGQALKYIAQ